MLVEIVAGVLLGYAVLAVVAVVALPRRARRPAPSDRPGSGPPADLPTGTAMLPVDVWDAVVVVLVLGMVLSVPVVGGVVAALLVPALVLAPLLVLRALGNEAAARSHRLP